MYKHILVPTDGSPLSKKAVKTAARLARDMNARVTALNVIPEYRPTVAEEAAVAYVAQLSEKQFTAAARQHSDKLLNEAKRVIGAGKVECETATVTDVQPWRAIVETARGRKCDLIVMASHGRRGLSALLLGSETTKVLTHSKTPVLVCR